MSKHAEVLRLCEAETPEKWAAFKEAVASTRADLVATDTDKNGNRGKWAVRYPNGRRVAEETDVVFQTVARNTVLNLMEEVERLNAELDTLDGDYLDLSEGLDSLNSRLDFEHSCLVYEQETVLALKKEVRELNDANAALSSQLAAALAPKPPEEAPVIVGPANVIEIPEPAPHLTEASKEAPAKAKRSRKAKDAPETP